MIHKHNDVCPKKMVLVAVKASKEISRTGLIWALTHVVQPGDCIKLLVVIPSHSSINKIWGFSKFNADCTTSRWSSGTSLDQREDVVESCSEMMRQLRNVYDHDKIKIRVKVVSDSSCGIVADEAKKVQSNWVILDKRLKHEKKYCMEKLNCNVVVLKRSKPKILRLNLNESQNKELESFELPFPQHLESKHSQTDILRGPFVTPASSPDHESLMTTTDVGTSSISSSEPGTSPFFISRVYKNRKKSHSFIPEENQSLCESDSDTNDEELASRSSSLYFQPWTDEIFSPSAELSKHSHDSFQSSTYQMLMQNLSKFDQDPHIEALNYKFDLNFSKSVREAVSLSRNAPSGPPPLCSLCQHKTPSFGNPPKWFTYPELKLATDGFSNANFLAEGGFGLVHRGVLPDGQVVAVKQYKLASSQGDVEFCSEVEVLSCAQHRNVVMLIGFCVEDGKRLLVYEYICNRSLDTHLYGHSKEPLEWSARQRIAVGAAKGLRYLHEECRVGCIVHRDMRPNNILLTHDFEPLVGDFGLARWQPNGDMGEETRIIGTFGYLAPEYAQSGQITEKADVYSFGVVLLELVTGRKAIGIDRPKGEQCLTEWARALFEKNAIDELVDPRLRNCYSQHQVYNMLQCASLCISRDSHSRPRMSQVLRMLEG